MLRYSSLDICELYCGDHELLLKLEERLKGAEETIKFLAVSAPFSPSLTSNRSNQKQVWATDGSIQPALARIGDNRTITTAITGPQTQ